MCSEKRFDSVSRSFAALLSYRLDRNHFPADMLGVLESDGLPGGWGVS